MAITSHNHSGQSLAGQWTNITPGTTALSQRPFGLYLGTGGTLTVVDEAGNECTFYNHPAGYCPLRPVQVLATSTAANAVGAGVTTTAAQILALY